MITRRLQTLKNKLYKDNWTSLEILPIEDFDKRLKELEEYVAELSEISNTDYKKFDCNNSSVVLQMNLKNIHLDEYGREILKEILKRCSMIDIATTENEFSINIYLYITYIKLDNTIL